MEDTNETNKQVNDDGILKQGQSDVLFKEFETKILNSLSDFLKDQKALQENTQDKIVSVLEIARKEADQKATTAEEMSRKYWDLYEKEIKSHNETKKQKDDAIITLQKEKADVEERYNNLVSETKEFEFKIKVSTKELEKKELELQAKNNQLTENQSTIQQLETEKNKLIEKNTEIEDEYNSIKNKYSKLGIDRLIDAYLLYSSINGEPKQYLKSIIPQDTFICFISIVLKWTNIALVWDYAKRNVFNGKMEEISELNNLFCMLVDIYNTTLPEPLFELINPEIGANYNPAEHAIKEIKTKGTVDAVFLVGYKNIKEGNLHKAVISIKD